MNEFNARETRLIKLLRLIVDCNNYENTMTELENIVIRTICEQLTHKLQMSKSNTTVEQYTSDCEDVEYSVELLQDVL